MATDLLEDDFREPYTAFKKTPTPDTRANLLTALHPVIEGAIRTHVGPPNPLLISRARMMTLDGLGNYDPSRGKLKTHLYNHLLGLRRVNRQQTQILKVPERIAMQRQRLDRAEQELTHTLGREPTDQEIADHTGIAVPRMSRVRSYKPGVAEGSLEAASGGIYGGVVSPVNKHTQSWMAIIYDDLDPYHRRVMELSLGMNGRKPMANQDIARRLNRSPGAISQAKARIQALLNEEDELSPFGARHG